VLTLACEFGQDKLLGQTAGNMESHISPESFENKSRAVIRIW